MSKITNLKFILKKSLFPHLPGFLQVTDLFPVNILYLISLVSLHCASQKINLCCCLVKKCIVCFQINSTVDNQMKHIFYLNGRGPWTNSCLRFVLVCFLQDIASKFLCLVKVECNGNRVGNQSCSTWNVTRASTKDMKTGKRQNKTFLELLEYRNKFKCHSCTLFLTI